jgi:hypothetical protein
LKSIVDRIEHDEGIKGVVLMSGKPGSFVAGADVTMLQKCKSNQDAEKLSRDGQIQFERLERSKKPVVAGIVRLNYFQINKFFRWELQWEAVWNWLYLVIIGLLLMTRRLNLLFPK